MNKQEFSDFCHNEFTQRGFKKRKKMYYRKGKNVLCGLWLQKSMSEAYYVNYEFFIGEYNDEKSYPTHYDSDISHRICVLSKDTINEVHFMGALIKYEKYTKEELKPYFEDAFEKIVLPPIEEGKEYFVKNPELYLVGLFPEELEKVGEKLNLSQEMIEEYITKYEQSLEKVTILME